MSMERLERVAMRRIETRTDAAGARAVHTQPVALRLAPGPAQTDGLPRTPAARGRMAAAPLRLAGQATGAQSTLAFLQRSQALLDALRGALADHLSTRSGEADALTERVARFERHWQERHAASGGRLCERLVYGEADSARRIFRLRGLDAVAAAGDRSELLAFHTGLRMAPCVVRLDGRATAQAQLRHLSEALAPLGVLALDDGDGRLAFSVAESRWPALVRELAISGEGVRFSGGRPNRVHAEPLPGAIVPGAWRWDGPDATHASLAQVGAARDAVRQLQLMLRAVIEHARQAVADAIDEAGASPDPHALLPTLRRASLCTRVDARHASTLLRLPGPPR